ncbi:MAG: glycosyltransferase involved in cell wall biosynthesis, partial [Patiriisocius sp.]
LLHEVIFIDDGSTDSSWDIITTLKNEHSAVKGIRFLKNFGKSQALHAGFKMAKGNVVITMDADLQDNPEEIPALYKMIIEEKYDLVSGWKKKRFDPLIGKNLPSKLFNFAARKTSGVQLNDFNCGLKAYHHDVIKTIEVTGEMHRYIPVLAKNAGFSNIGEKVVQHQARKYGETKFGAERFVRGFLDLITIWFLSSFGKRPMHLFGAWGAVMLLIGFCFAMYLGIDKLFINEAGRLITERPEFYIALTAMILGTQLFLAGFIGELILRTKKNVADYIISETV